jgi:hypothetical protein
LNLISSSGSFNQILVGYIDGATNGWDRDFDGVRFTDNNSTTFYSVIPERELVIQGRPTPFSMEDQINLGYKSTLQENFSLRLDHFDGLFDQQEIYIEDTALHTIHDLKESPYNFTSEIGTFNERFILKFMNTALGTSDFETNQNIIALIQDKFLIIEASQNIKAIEIYDISGKLISTSKLQDKRKDYKENFYYAAGVYLAKIKLENGFIAIKKLINKQ